MRKEDDCYLVPPEQREANRKQQQAFLEWHSKQPMDSRDHCSICEARRAKGEKDTYVYSGWPPTLVENLD